MSSVALPPIPPASAPPSTALRRFTVDEYHELIRIGMLKGDERVELLEGWIVHKMTHNPLHDVVVDRVQEALRDRVSRNDWRVRVQSATTTTDSEPEPDVVIARGPAERYLQRHPGPEDIALIVEVADSSLSRDRNQKLRLYARAGIAVYWIVNLPDSAVEVYSDPASANPVPEYRSLERFHKGDAIPLTVAGQNLEPVPVNEILPTT
jgi:Uma2 family endonuclease